VFRTDGQLATDLEPGAEAQGERRVLRERRSPGTISAATHAASATSAANLHVTHLVSGGQPAM
jgi:hypothetical protein